MFDVIGPFGKTRIQWDLCGLHNISNALAAFAACMELGIEIQEIRIGLENFKAPTWRMEVSDLGCSRKLISRFL